MKKVTGLLDYLGGLGSIDTAHPIWGRRACGGQSAFEV